MSVNKGIACRICKNNQDGVCVQGKTESVNKVDECWLFQNRSQNSALAEHSENNTDWRLW